MWNYEKRLQYPVNISTPNAELAKIIISQYGGPDGEMGASMRYLSQRYVMPYRDCKAVLTDIGREASEMFRFLQTALKCSVFPSKDFRAVKLHLNGSSFRYMSTLSLSFTTILSRIPV